MAATRRRVHLHVGLPKTGTTFLQASLQRNTGRLADVGVLHPDGPERMFLAALDVRTAHRAWGRRRAEVEGTWDDLARLARRHDGDTVLSSELLAAAAPREVVKALSVLKGLDVHVVVTARDPARQAAAEWQEGVRHGRRLTFEEFRHQVLDGTSETDYARRFRAAHDLPAVLARWGADLPPDHVHVVTCPPADAPRDVLWQRFTAALDVDATAMPSAGPESANASLGVDEVDLLRRVNAALDRRLRQPAYGSVVRSLYAAQLLRAGASAHPVVPAEMLDDLRLVGRRWAKEVDRAGYVVHGDLADLEPVAAPRSAPHPDEVDPRAQVDVAAAATAELLVEVQRGREEIARLEVERDRQRTKRKRLKRRLRALTGD